MTCRALIIELRDTDSPVTGKPHTKSEIGIAVGASKGWPDFVLKRAPGKDDAHSEYLAPLRKYVKRLRAEREAALNDGVLATLPVVERLSTVNHHDQRGTQRRDTPTVRRRTPEQHEARQQERAALHADLGPSLNGHLDVPTSRLPDHPAPTLVATPAPILEVLMSASPAPEPAATPTASAPAPSRPLPTESRREARQDVVPRADLPRLERVETRSGNGAKLVTYAPPAPAPAAPAVPLSKSQQFVAEFEASRVRLMEEAEHLEGMIEAAPLVFRPIAERLRDDLMAILVRME